MLNSVYAGARGVVGNIHLPLPSINRLNQSEPATLSVLLCVGLSLSVSFLLYLQSYCTEQHVLHSQEGAGPN